jgi:hypothetical protein
VGVTSRYAASAAADALRAAGKLGGLSPLPLKNPMPTPTLRSPPAGAAA